MFGSNLEPTIEEPVKTGGCGFMTYVTRPVMCATGESGDIGEGVPVVERMGERESGEDQVVITLSETETINLLDIPGSLVVDLGQQETVRNSNLTYQEVYMVYNGDGAIVTVTVFISWSRIVKATTSTQSTACRP